MFTGDEHALMRAVSGTLPSLLKGELLITVPRSMTRILRSLDRIRQGESTTGGQISSRLRALTPRALEAVLDPEPCVYRVVTEDELRPSLIAVKNEAATKGIPLTPLGSELTAAAQAFDATIWLGHDRNQPRWATQGPGLDGVRWRRLSDLTATPRLMSHRNGKDINLVHKSGGPCSAPV